ncbi:MAG: SIS domain-containing protein [Chloroflexota bacterium]
MSLHGTETALHYMNMVQQKLNQIIATQMESITAAAGAVEKAVRDDGMVYLFGTGHSHMLAEEGHYRAGGLVPVCPILSTSLMLHEGAIASTGFERTRGFAKHLLARYEPRPTDTIIIFSNSGVNAVPVEMGQLAQEIGMATTAVIAKAYAESIEPRIDGKRLADYADIVIDNGGIPGDALVEVHSSGLMAGPLSTVAGAFILNAILIEAVQRLGTTETPPVYISANMPGAAEHNSKLIARYKSRNPHL